MLSTVTETASHEGRFRRLAVAVGIVGLIGFGGSAQAVADTVTNADDSGPGSLRGVIAGADAGETIDFDPSLDGQKIDLTSGAIAIAKSLTIDGPGASQLAIDAGHDSRIFTVTTGALSISDLTLANGAAPDNGGAIDHRSGDSLNVSGITFIGNTAGGTGDAGSQSGYGRGGAIHVLHVFSQSPSISVSGSTFVANTAGGDGGDGFLSGRGEGGAIADYSVGSLIVSNSTFTANAVGGATGSGNGSGRGAGGAISAMGSGSLRITDSTFSANAVSGQSGGSGGAVRAWNRSLTVSGSTFADNTVGQAGGGGSGGAIDAGAVSSQSAPASISNSTLVGNAAGGGGAAGRGGAIDVVDMSSANLANVTIDANSVGEGGAGAGFNSKTGGVNFGGATVTAKATLVSGNAGATNCDAPVAVTDASLEGPSSSHTSCGFDLPSADPQLAPLADNGGPTETQAPTLSSPAVGAVPRFACPTSTDQRGAPRPEPGGAFCDVGAFERQDPVAPQPPPTVPPPPQPPNPPNPPGPPSPPQPPSPKPPPPLELSAEVQRRTLGKLVRTGRLVVVAKADAAAKLTVTGRAKLRVRANGRQRKMFVTVFKTKTARLGSAGRKQVTLVLTRKGRRALRELQKVRLAIVVGASDGSGETTRAKVALTLRRR